MSIFWVTDSNLGSYGVEHSFNSDPIILEFVADPFSTVTLVSGSLPLGLNWEFWPNTIRIYGDAVLVDAFKSQTFSFTFRVEDLSGIFVDKTFILELLVQPTPVWGTYYNLGNFEEGYSFISAPLSIYYEADKNAKVSLLNGNLPPGISWTQDPQNYRVIISNSPNNVNEETLYSWTFRLTNPQGTITDRTFEMTIRPIVELPVWITKSELGYVTLQEKKEFKLEATLGTEPIVYFHETGYAPHVRLDSERGILYYDGSLSNVSINTEEIIVKAIAGNGNYSSKTFYIRRLAGNSAPAWTTSNVLYSIDQETYLRFPLETYLPRSGNVQYTITSNSVGFPFKLDSDGLIYGEAPIVNIDQLHTVTVNAYVVGETVTSSSEQTFKFEIKKTVNPSALKWRNSAEIINVTDGVRIVFDIGAASTRKSTVKHSIIGGQVPPGIILDKIQGYLVGFVEYHCVDKDYYFNIQASDDVDIIVRTIHMRVIANFRYQFSELKIPLTGDIKQRWLSTSNFIMTNGNISPNVDVTGDTLFQPYLPLIKGLNSTLDKPESIIADVWSGLKELNLRVSNAEIVTTNTGNDILLYRNIIDEQEGTAYEVPYSIQPYNFRPASLDNIRQIFKERCKLATGGGGEGATAITNVNPETGTILTVEVINSGAGYTHAPVVTISSPTGKGARFKSYLKLISIKVIEPGNNWQPGENLTLEIGSYEEPAEIVITNTTSNGGLLSFIIVNGGRYSISPVGKIYIRNKAGIATGINPDFGLATVETLNGGEGYEFNNTTVNFDGIEVLPDWLPIWKPYIPVALANQSFSNTVVNNSELAISRLLDGAVWQVGDLEWTIQGIHYQGATRFTNDEFTLDGGTTRFEEFIEPRQTIFDTSYLTFEQNYTTYDVGVNSVRDAKINWGKTIIDDYTTAFEFYATIFDIPKAPTESLTTIRRIIPLEKGTKPYI